MKTKSFIIAMSVFFALGLSFPFEVSARGHRPPAWAPAHGFRAHTRQVYFPKYNCYYDIEHDNYIYINNGRWTVSVDLPIRFRPEYFRNTSYIEMNINSRYPQYYNAEHRARYNVIRHYDNDNRNNYGNQRYYRNDDRGRYKENKHWNNEREREDRHGNGHGRGHNDD
jgi:hypothetical protein